MYRNILYPSNGSESAAGALDDVRSLAETYNATVHILYVAETKHSGLGDDPNRETSPGMVGDPEGADTPMVGDRELSRKIREKEMAFAESHTREVARQLGNLDTQIAVHGGQPYQNILKYAEANEIDIIVIGTNGRTGLDRYLLGSVAEKVLRLADIPVLMIRNSDGF